MENEDLKNEDFLKIDLKSIIEVEELWDLGINDKINDTEAKVNFLVIKVKRVKNISDIDYHIGGSVMNANNQAQDAFGNPTANIVNVFTCLGCVARNRADGPYRLSLIHI